MQVVSSYILGVGYLFVVAVWAQNDIVISSDTTKNPGAIIIEGSSTDLQNDNTTALLVTLLTTENSTKKLNISDSSTIFLTTLKNFTNDDLTTSANNSYTTAGFRVGENTAELYENTTTADPITSATTQTATTEPACIAPSSISVTVTEEFKTEVNISIVMNFPNVTIICPIQNEITCNATDNNTMWWVVQTQNFTLEPINDTKPYDFILGNFSAFTNYTCELTNEYSIHSEFSFQTKEEVPSSPVQLNVTTINSTMFQITWKEPEKIPSLLEGYQVTILRRDMASESHFWKKCSNNDTTIINVTETNYLFDEALAGFFYNVTVKAISEVGYGEDASSTTSTPAPDPNSINVTITETLKTEVNIHIVINLSSVAICPMQIKITCNATDVNNTMPSWVVPTQNFTLEPINDTEPHDFMLGNFSAFTNYTCVLTNQYSIHYEFSFQTKQEVPSSPAQLNITTLSSTIIQIRWEEPEIIPSILEGYQVTILRGDVASEGHFWNNCFENDTITKNVTEKEYLFNEALADFFYNVTVKAISNVGYGEAVGITTSTPPAASDPPKNVTFELPEEEMSYKNIVTTQKITWYMPCNTNGPVNYFQIELNGTYLYNESRTDLRTATVNVTQNQTYSYEFPYIWAASNYKVKIYLLGTITGNVYNSSFVTDDNYPSAPVLETKVVSSQGFSLIWDEPTNNPGYIENYTVNIQGLGVNWARTEDCNLSDAEYKQTEYGRIREYATTRVVPDANYSISVAGNTARGEGNWSKVSIITDMSYPDPFSISNQISNGSNPENYDENVTIKLAPGCFNGKFDSYIVNFTGIRIGYQDHSGIVRLTEYDVNEYTFGLKPQYDYRVNVTLKNEEYNRTNFLNFTAPAGVPAVDFTNISNIEVSTEDTQTTLILNREYFDESRGSLIWLAVIVSDENITGGSFSRWEDPLQWPTPTGNSSIYYQATPKYWEPFKASNTCEFTLGTDTNCSDDQYCNKPLQPGKQYFVLLRLFNTDYYRNTMPISFITNGINKIGFILAIIFSFLAVVIFGFTVFLLWRKGYIIIRNPLRSEQQGMKTEIPVKRFVSYCKYLEQYPEVLKAQWNELENKSNTIYNELPHHFSTLPENKRKNRYTNILPFDHSRVKLNIDEDDEICSDYINASYIKGFSNQKEYIATQGPLPGTCRDFWKMILQERVSIIVMVSKFIENNRDKCYKYFPNNRETMTIIGDDIEVRCSTELHFGFYCIRTLQVKKELKQVTVTHMQFLEWPDFGVPSGTESMLHFCHQLKERWASEGGLAVVHCSAGVGRTGTIIATDILLRSLEAGRKIDVFNTVLDLRRQRKSMVQTEKQYMYIHQLISTMIEFPIVKEQDNQDHVYENVGVRTKTGIVESSF